MRRLPNGNPDRRSPAQRAQDDEAERVPASWLRWSRWTDADGWTGPHTRRPPTEAELEAERAPARRGTTKGRR